MHLKKTSRRNFLISSSVAAVSPGLLQEKAGEPRSAGTPLSVLCIGAHPGDPEFGCGGTLLKYSEDGHRVKVLYLTRGEASDPKTTFTDMARLRTAEAEASCKILKVTPSFAGQIDGNTEYNNKAADTMTKLILDARPDVVFTHWPLDTHKDHQIAGVLTLNAWTKGGQQFDLFFYEVNTGAETMGFTPTVYEDISTQRERKKAALMAHKTQNPEEVYQRYFKTMEDFRGLEAGVAAAEAFVHFKASTSARKP